LIPSGADASGLLARMENVPFTRWHATARVIMGSATFFDAFNSLSLAFALPILIGLWHISPGQSGFLIASSYAGQLAGALLFTWLAEKFGRIPSATAGIAIMALMTLACAIAGSFSVLLACRFVQGIGIGGEMPVAAAYISELSRARGRGRFFLLYEMIFPVGLMAAGQLGAWLVPAFGWQAIFLIGSIPCVIITILVARLPESPRWLISKGRLLEAEAIVKQMEASGGHMPSSVPVERPNLDVKKHATQWSELLSHSYRSRTLIVWALWFCAYFIANSLNNWLPSLYNTVYHLGLRPALRAASMTNVAQVIVLLICAFSIDRIGRRNWTVVSFIAGAALLGLLGYLASTSVTSVMILATLSYGLIGSSNAVLYLYTPEIYPTRMRAIGTGVATSWLRLASAIGPALVGYMVGAMGIGSVFLMFAAVGIVGAFAAACMIETRGQRLEVSGAGL
jgi:MFS transporter, putative metabolite:H+ symporter